MKLPAEEELFASTAGGGGVGGYRDAESLFRSKPISEIRIVEAATRKQIHNKKEELRQLVGNRYRDLIDSADSIVLMKSSSESISTNIFAIRDGIRSLSERGGDDIFRITPKLARPDPGRVRIYDIACRVKYLVDTPENIWGRIDESMFLEAAGRYIRAKHVHHSLNNTDAENSSILSNFALLQHQWQIVESFKAHISQRSRERLLVGGLKIDSYADALAATSVIDELEPKHVLGLLLDTRRSWICQKISTCSSTSDYSTVVPIFCNLLKIIQVSIGQVGELFLQVFNDMPLYYRVVLGSPPAAQLFGGIPNPDEEVRLWKLFRDKLESINVMLDQDFISITCSTWLRNCGQEIFRKVNGKYLIDTIASGNELASAEKLIRETMDSKEVMEGSLEWLKAVFGSEVEFPCTWSRIRELVLNNDDSDLWDEIFENAFVQRMKAIVEENFANLTSVVNVRESIESITEIPVTDKLDYSVNLNKRASGGGVWFLESNIVRNGIIPGSNAHKEENDFLRSLNIYLGPEISRIRDAVDSCCQVVLKDLVSFLESPKASLRLKDLAPYVQSMCYDSISSILTELKKEVEHLYDATGLVENNEGGELLKPTIIVERSLFIGRLLFAFQNHSKHVPVILGSPRFWVNETVSAVFDRLSQLRNSAAGVDSPISEFSEGRPLNSSKRQTSLATTALLGAIDGASPKLEELAGFISDLGIRAYGLWISWVSEKLYVILSRDLRSDDTLSTTIPLRGWEETTIKQEQSSDEQTEIKISLPFIPSLYLTSFLFRACEEIHQVGGHVLDKPILQKLALTLLEKVIKVYEEFIPTERDHECPLSEKGVLQVLLDLRFAEDVLSAHGFSSSRELQKSSKTKFPFRGEQGKIQDKSDIQEHVNALKYRLSQLLDPIDWLTYEPYLWENERQSYLRHAVLFGFFVQLNRKYTDSVQKLSTNSESNIMRCSAVPRFKYLPISAPALSSRGMKKTSSAALLDSAASRNSWKAYTNGEVSQTILDDALNFGVAAPFLKSFMQVGSRFGELGSILSDGHVGMFKDKSAAAMSSFGDILPAHAAGLLSSFTAPTRSNSS